MLEVKNVSKRYGKKEVLKSVNITLDKGIYGLLGENGAGKTTLIHIITGLLTATEGDVYYDGNEIVQLSKKYRAVLGYMPQFSTFYPNFTAEEFLKYMCILKGISRKESKERISKMLQMVNLEEVRKNKIGTFSGGMRQRLGIAQAMLNNPDILVLDEPTAGLDPGERIRFRELIADMAAKRTVILATHIVQDVEYIAHQVILIHKGRLIVQDKPSSLLDELEENVHEFISPKGEATLEDVFLYYTKD